MITSLSLVFSLIIFSALISCFETSITAASRATIHRFAKEGNRGAKILEKLLKEREKIVSVMLLTNNISNIIASAITTKVLLDLFGEIGVLYATIALTILVIVFGEILPKTYAIKSPEKIAINFAWLINILFRIFSPITLVVQKIVEIFIGKNAAKKSNEAELEEIRDTLDLKAKEGSIEKSDKDLFDGIFDLSDTQIDEIMVHRKDIEAINFDLEISKIIEQATASNYTRIPLWRGDKDNIVAILNVRKLLKELHSYRGNLEKFELSNATSTPWFVPASNSLRAQLFAFRKKKKRFALVIDEYGSLLGLVTVEDILEEIVGEIKEGEEASQINIVKTKSGIYKIAGKTLIRDINKKLDWEIVESDAAYNLAAFIIHHLGYVPEEKANFVIDGYYFEVLKRGEHELLWVKVKKIVGSR